MKIVLNAGHGEGDSGAAFGNLLEADITQRFVDCLADEIERVGAATVVKARNLDVSVGGEGDRADMVLAFHVNAGGGTGCEALIHTRAVKGTTKLVNDLLATIASTWGIRIRGLKQGITMPAGWPSDELYCFKRPTERVEALIELAFIDHEIDRAHLEDSGRLERLARYMARDICSVLNTGVAIPKDEPHAGQPKYTDDLKKENEGLRAQLEAKEGEVYALTIAREWANEQKGGMEHWLREVHGIVNSGAMPSEVFTRLHTLFGREGIEEFIEKSVLSGSRANMVKKFGENWEK